MIADKQIRAVWDEILDYGENHKIAEEKNIDARLIGVARNTGVCTEKTFNAINDFVARKKARIEESTKKVTE
jgi:hypothetical protein